MSSDQTSCCRWQRHVASSASCRRVPGLPPKAGETAEALDNLLLKPYEQGSMIGAGCHCGFTLPKWTPGLRQRERRRCDALLHIAALLPSAIASAWPDLTRREAVTIARCSSTCS